MFLQSPLQRMVSLAYFSTALCFGLFFSGSALAQYHTSSYSADNLCGSQATLHGYVNPFFISGTNRWFEWGTTPEYLPNHTATTRNTDNTEVFEQTIYNLAPNTAYYFRSVAQNSKGTVYGKAIEFKIKNGVACAGATNTNTNTNTNTGMQTNTNTASNNTNSGTTNTNANANTNINSSSPVITKRATDIINTGARLNAVVLPMNTLQTYGWFEWGGTPDTEYRSIRRYVGAGQVLSSALPFGETLSGLTPGTTYFFKPMIENQNGISEGALFSFRTTGMTPASSIVPATFNNTVANNTAKISTPTTRKITPTPTLKTANSGAVATNSNGQKIVKIEIIPNTDTVAIKEHVNQTIQLENTTDKTLKNVTVRVIVPDEAEYIPTGGDAFVQNGKVLTYTVGDMKPKEKIRLLFWMQIGAVLADKTPIETIAVITWTNETKNETTSTAHPNDTKNDTQSVGRSTMTLDANKISKESAAAIGAVKSTGSIFPQNLGDWGAIIGTLFLLFAAYLVFLLMRRKKEEETLQPQEAIVVSKTAAPAIHPALNLSPVGVPHRKYNTDPFVTEENLQKKRINNSVVLPVASVAVSHAVSPAKKNVSEKAVPPDNLPV